MANKKPTPQTEPDSVFFLKIVVYFIIGVQWVRLVGLGDAEQSEFAIPVGLLFGVILARHDHFAIDRKIEYAVLLIAAVLSYAAPIGFVI